MENIKKIRIANFQPKDQIRTQKLINLGLGEHWGFIDPQKNPDLEDIAAYYSNDLFLIAWLNDELVGTGALVRQTEQIAKIVRMSVAAEMRRLGIGTKILDVLVQQAKTRGYHQIILETTNTWEDSKNFYLANGFQITHHQDRNVYFKLDLD